MRRLFSRKLDILPSNTDRGIGGSVSGGGNGIMPLWGIAILAGTAAGGYYGYTRSNHSIGWTVGGAVAGNVAAQVIFAGIVHR